MLRFLNSDGLSRRRQFLLIYGFVICSVLHFGYNYIHLFFKESHNGYETKKFINKYVLNNILMQFQNVLAAYTICYIVNFYRRVERFGKERFYFIRDV